MHVADIPAKFPMPWASAAGGAYIRDIPDTSQIGVNAGFASFPDGFVPLNATPVGAGGVPPFIQDFNGIIKAVTSWDQWYQAGGPVAYDAAFQADVGGYPLGAVVASATTPGRYWRSTTDANVTNPDAAGAGWADFFAPVYASPTFSGAVTNGGTLVQTGAATFNGPVTFNTAPVFSAGLSFPGGGAINGSGTYVSPGSIQLGDFSAGFSPSSQLLSVNNPVGIAAAFQARTPAPGTTAMFVRSDRTDGYLIQFYYTASLVGSISTNGTSTAFTTTSDYRVKSNFEPMEGAADRLMRLKPIRFNWKQNPDGEKVDGFLAHEVQEVVPEAASGVKDGMEEVGELFFPAKTVLAEEVVQPDQLEPDVEWVKTGTQDDKTPIGKLRTTAPRVAAEDCQQPQAQDMPEGMKWRSTGRRPILQGVDQSKLVPLLVAALQEALGRIAALEATQGR